MVTSYNDDDSFLSSLRYALSLLLRTKDNVFAAALNVDLTYLIESQSSTSPLQLLGLAWIGVGRLILHLAVPDIPLDPILVEHVNYSRLKREEADLSDQIRLHAELENLLTGNTDNNTTLHLKSLLSQRHSHLLGSSTISYRQDIPRLHLFWSEVAHLKDSVLSSMKMQSLLTALLTSHPESISRERVFQESLASFCQRCDAVYPEFLDLTVILKLSILSLRLGVRTLLDSTSSMTAHKSTTRMHEALVLFPSVCSTSLITRTFGPIQPPSAIFHGILLTLAASSVELSLGASTSEILPIVETAYEQAIGLWLIDRAREKEWEKETNSLYRSGLASDAQSEEEDFLSIFPTYEGVFETTTIASKIYGGRPVMLIQAKDAVSLLQIHFSITTTHSKNSFDAFGKFKAEIIRDLLQHSPDSSSDSIDQSGRHLQLTLLHENIKRFTTNIEGQAYNFYMDSNYPQLRRASSIVTNLRRRLQSLAKEWPDHMVLKHLVERCNSILSITATSPLAKVLAMVEQLLVQTNDWEAYAHRENSIKFERDQLVVLIIDWRRSELACWQTLLDAQSTAFLDEMFDWWFRLYDALVRGALSASQEGNWSNGAHSYLDTLIPLLDDFMQGGPMGQFHARLQLLTSFDKYTKIITPLKTSSDKKILDAINKLIHATCSYYSLYSESLHKHLQDQKRTLEKEVEGFIKLASWKDVNVEALRQSAKKSHHHLYKIIRKFREVLRQPVRHHLQPHLSGGGEGQALRFTAVTLRQNDLTSSQKAHPLTRTQDRLHRLIADDIKPVVESCSAEIVDEVAVEIITTSSKLAGYMVPSSLSGEPREKHVSSLQVRKRKAWSDLLKELKRSGLSSNLKPEILHQNSSQTWVRQQPNMPSVTTFNIDVNTGETYFNKLCGSLPALRGGLSLHHSDLSTRELQRGVAFLECGFSMAVDLRVR